MGNHRGARRASSRGRSERPAGAYTGRRVAGRHTGHPSRPTPETSYDVRAVDARPAAGHRRDPDPLHRHDHRTRSARLCRASVAPRSPRGPGSAACRRCRSSSASPPWPSPPAACSRPAGPQLVGSETPRVTAPNAASGEIGGGYYDALGRSPVVSRDSDRDALDDASEATLVEEVEIQVEQRNEALGDLVEKAEKEAENINLNRWVLPAARGYRLTVDVRSGRLLLVERLPHRPRLRRSDRHADHGRRQRRGDLRGLRRRLRQPDRRHPRGRHRDLVLPPELLRRLRRRQRRGGPDHRLRRLDRQHHRSAPPPRGPPGGGDPVDPYAALVVNGANPS